MFSIIIPVYNREWSIIRAIDSAISFISNFNNGEIIIVDDCSTDSSVTIINKIIKNSNCNIKLIELKKNSGVNNARNTGCKASVFDWILFLDSDDELIASSAPRVEYFVKKYNKIPLHFFKCIDSKNNFIGRKFDESKTINLNEIILKGTYGESLVVINRECILKNPYYTEYNGFEGLLYIKIIDMYGAAKLNSIAVRKYHTEHDTRLSSIDGIKKRRYQLYSGYRFILFTYFKKLFFINKVYISIKTFYHLFLHIKSKFI
jgi:glycosyltransferase involved in cell wall biosynthesis